MKALLFTIFFLTALLLKSQSDTTLGPHKGRMQTYLKYHIELVGCNDYIEVYFYDHAMNLLNNKYGISGDVKYYLADQTFSEVPLTAYGADGFTARMPTPDYVYCRVSAIVTGQPVTAKFNNECTAPVGSK